MTIDDLGLLFLGLQLHCLTPIARPRRADMELELVLVGGVELPNYFVKAGMRFLQTVTIVES